MAAVGQPNLDSVEEISGLMIYEDKSNPQQFYYAPGSLQVAENNGKQDIQIVQLRNIGQYATGDQGEIEHTNFLQAGIQMNSASRESLKSVKNELGRRLSGSIKLDRLPITDIKCSLIVPDPGATSMVITGGNLEQIDAARMGSGYWNERKLFVPLSNEGSQILWTLATEKKLAFSLFFSFECIGWGGENISVEYFDPDELWDADVDRLLPKADSTETNLKTKTVVADAIGVVLEDPINQGNLIKVDVDNNTLPSWSLLEVRCYAFQGLDTLNYKKVVEFRANGATGEYVKTQCEFSSQSPDVVVNHLKFPFAVKMDVPYQWRIVNYSKMGTREEGNWQPESDWFKMLDITHL